VNLSRAAWLRIIPFVLFMALLALRAYWPPQAQVLLDSRWLYALNLPLVGGLLLWWWLEYGELARQNLPTLREAGIAVAIGLLVFVLWIQLTAPWMQIGEASAAYRPIDASGALDWPQVIVRCLGAALVVPVMEELFWRSFLMRWFDDPTFQRVDPRRASWRAMLLSTFVFVLVHTLWLAAAIAGLAYALLYRATGKLWAAVIAHAVTNGALGIYVVATQRWAFW
jgi:CAAX prenyl protease-like protein